MGLDTKKLACHRTSLANGGLSERYVGVTLRVVQGITGRYDHKFNQQGITATESAVGWVERWYPPGPASHLLGFARGLSPDYGGETQQSGKKAEAPRLNPTYRSIRLFRQKTGHISKPRALRSRPAQGVTHNINGISLEQPGRIRKRVLVTPAGPPRIR